jgi:hypothetical protein
LHACFLQFWDSDKKKYFLRNYESDGWNNDLMLLITLVNVLYINIGQETVSQNLILWWILKKIGKLFHLLTNALTDVNIDTRQKKYH